MPINYFPQINNGTGESNFGENLGAGAGVYKDKSGLVLRFRSLKSSSDIINLIENSNDIEIDVDLSKVDLENCDNTVSEFIKKIQILDENDFASDSNEFPASQLSIKNYIENNTKLEHESLPKLSANAELENNLLIFKNNPNNLNYSGIAIKGNITSNTNGIGSPLFLKSDGTYQEAGSSELSANKAIGIALESGVGVKLILLCGILKNNTWSFTAGERIFLSTNLGEITNVAPSGSGEIVQLLGYSLSSDTIYFNPSFTDIELS